MKILAGLILAFFSSQPAFASNGWDCNANENYSKKVRGMEGYEPYTVSEVCRELFGQAPNSIPEKLILKLKSKREGHAEEEIMVTETHRKTEQYTTSVVLKIDAIAIFPDQTPHAMKIYFTKEGGIGRGWVTYYGGLVGKPRDIHLDFEVQ